MTLMKKADLPLEITAINQKNIKKIIIIQAMKEWNHMINNGRNIRNQENHLKVKMTDEEVLVMITLLMKSYHIFNNPIHQL